MKILITGSRNWKWKGPIEGVMGGFHDATFIVGDCPTGVDRIVLDYARAEGLDITVYDANWDKHGKAAGPLRNTTMIAAKPDVCFAFRSEGASEGTDDCVYQANIAGIPTYIMRKLPNLADINYVVEGINFNKKARNHGR